MSNDSVQFQMEVGKISPRCSRSLDYAELSHFTLPLDLFGHTAAIFVSIVSKSYYGMLRGQIHTNLPREHPIIAI